MEYRCNVKPVQKIVQDDGTGASLSLCSSCKNNECRNPIENVSVSVFGLTIKGKFYKTNQSYYGVISCDGYQKDIKNLDNENEDN